MLAKLLLEKSSSVVGEKKGREGNSAKPAIRQHTLKDPNDLLLRNRCELSLNNEAINNGINAPSSCINPNIKTL